MATKWVEYWPNHPSGHNMKIEEYGISCTLAIRGTDGVQEHGPYKSLSDIPEAYYRYIIWLSIRDHNNEEIVYIRGPDASGDIKVQLIFDSVIDYVYNSDEKLSHNVLLELLADIIAQYQEKAISYIERLQSIQKTLV
jgi:hypothetical protein